VSPDRSPRKYPRTLRVNEVVRETIADQLERMEDPRLELVTITGVDLSPDLRHANVFYSALGDHDPEIEERLRGASRRLQAALGREVRLKYVPKLHFREDPAIEAGQRIEAILRDLDTQKHRRPKKTR
jgi:ribosome-binding factor A